ncbi:MAG: hypothetical protein U1G05_00330 [Kiritimatiellia bacterium]
MPTVSAAAPRAIDGCSQDVTGTVVFIFPGAAYFQVIAHRIFGFGCAPTCDAQDIERKFVFTKLGEGITKVSMAWLIGQSENSTNNCENRVFVSD